MDSEFVKLQVEYEKKTKELQELTNKVLADGSKPTKEQVNELMIVNFETQTLCECLLEKKAQLEPYLQNDIEKVLKKSRSHTYNC